MRENQSIIILQQDKGRGVVIMNRVTYTDKCFSILNSSQFTQLNHDPTDKFERKLQRVIRKLKPKLPSKSIYSSGSCCGKFYGITKIHKMSPNDSIQHLPIQPIVSNIGTARYHLSKYSASLLSPLSESEYTVKYSKSFVQKFKLDKIQSNYNKIVSFDLKSLFSNVSLDQTVSIILNRIYNNREINTDTSRSEMKELLYLCTKNVHFSFDNNIYIQNDGVAMGSPLGPILANIFMAELERSVIPGLANKLDNWRRYVDDTICNKKVDSIDYVLSKLNNFHRNIQFTVEVEKEGRISFLDVLMIRDKNNIETTIHRKPTNNNIYLNWTSHAPNKWKMGTLRTLVRRAYDICSTNEHLQNELSHINKVFHEQNQYPFWVINKVFCEIKRSNHQQLQEQHQQQLPTN